MRLRARCLRGRLFDAPSATVIIAEVAEELVRTVLYLRVEACFSCGYQNV